MTGHIAAQETINAARASIRRAARIDAGRIALDGALQDADDRLGEVRGWLDEGDMQHAQSAVAEALELLRTEQARYIATKRDALEDAISLLASIGWR